MSADGPSGPGYPSPPGPGRSPGAPFYPGHHPPYASGKCAVETAVPFIGTKFFWSCATDRNDDTFVTDAEVCAIEDDTAPGHARSGVTNHDECTGETIGYGGGAEEFADDWVNGNEKNGRIDNPNVADDGPRSFCFQDDVRGFTDPATDDTGRPAGSDVSAVNQAVFPPTTGDGYDTIVFFVGIPFPDTAAGVGVLTTYLQVAGDDDGCGTISADPTGHISNGNARTNQ